MLVASFTGLEKAQELYKTAIEKRYRFYSYGDAMLIL
jgi:S-adenosylmethionine:tRNA ribosyltransferase-isomerase